MQTKTINNPEEFASRIYILDELPTRAELQEFTKGKPGNFSLSDIGLSHSIGSTKPTYYLLRSRAPEQIENAERVAKLTGTEPAYSYGSQSRRILRWLNWSSPYSPSHRDFMGGMMEPHHFQHCKPWFKCPHITMYDLSAAYWQMCKRMPTPLVTFAGTHDAPRVRFHDISDKAKIAQWRTLCKFVDASPKMFRLVFVGCCVSGCKRQEWSAFHDGEELPIPGSIPALAGMAALAIRATYEVTQMQARAFESRYANSDCCTTEDDALPEVWEHLDLAYGVRAAGPADIRGRGVYKIGDYETDTYAAVAGSRWRDKHEGVDLPTVFHKIFLTKPT